MHYCVNFFFFCFNKGVINTYDLYVCVLQWKAWTQRTSPTLKTGARPFMLQLREVCWKSATCSYRCVTAIMQNKKIKWSNSSNSLLFTVLLLWLVALGGRQGGRPGQGAEDATPGGDHQQPHRGGALPHPERRQRLPRGKIRGQTCQTR